MTMLTPSVSAVPNSAHQRIASSLPLGKKTNPSAKTLGMKTTSVMIQKIVLGHHECATQ